MKTDPPLKLVTPPPAEPIHPQPAPQVTAGTPLTVRSVLPFVLLGCLFWALYFSIGSSLEKRNLFQNDLYFNSDTARIARDIGVFDAPHKRSNVHPLWILFATPIGSAFSNLIGSATRGPLILNSFVGGCSIALAGTFLLGAGIPLRRAVLFALILGCSAAHLFFGSLPETFSASAVSLIVLWLLVLKSPGRFFAFLAAGVFSFGILLTNAAPVALAYAVSFVALKPKRGQWLKVAGLIVLLPVCVLLISVALAAWQRSIWISTKPFYILKSFGYETRFMDPLNTVGAVVGREFLLFRHLFAYDWFAPNLMWVTPVKVIMQSGSLATIIGWGRVGLVIWSALLLLSGFLFFRGRLYQRAVPLGLALCLLFNIALHTKYGDDLFLYACNTCFLVLGLVALGTAELRLSAWKSVAFDLVLLLVLACEMANNQMFVARILSVSTRTPLF